MPAAYGELHFNREGYRLNFTRTPERRQVDYLRYLGASVETAKEVKLFGLERFLAGRFAVLSELMYGETRRLATRRALWGGLFATLSALSYYAGYAVILWRTLRGDITIGDLGFLAGSLLRLRGLLEGLLLGLSQLAAQAAYLDDLFSFFDIVPAVRSPADPVPFPVADPRRASASRASASATPRPSAGRSAASTSPSGPARSWRWWARTAPARPRS